MERWFLCSLTVSVLESDYDSLSLQFSLLTAMFRLSVAISTKTFSSTYLRRNITNKTHVMEWTEDFLS